MMKITSLFLEYKNTPSFENRYPPSSTAINDVGFLQSRGTEETKRSVVYKKVHKPCFGQRPLPPYAQVRYNLKAHQKPSLIKTAIPPKSPKHEQT